MVSVVFDFDRQFYLHATQTYHYGPLLTNVFPACGSLNGGTFVTITGTNLNDPSISSSQYPEDVTPIVELSFTINEDDDDSVVGDYRYFGISPSFDGEKVVFQTPYVEEDVFGKQIRIFVSFKDTNAKISVTPKNAFRYGPIVYNTQNLPRGKTSITNPNPSEGHTAGGETITIQGCGFSQFPTSLISPVIVQNGLTKGLCARGAGAGSISDTLRITSCGDNTDCEQITCLTTTLDCNAPPATSAESDVYVQFRPTNFTQYTKFPYTEPRASESPLTYSLGPKVTGISASTGYYLGGETITIQGKYFFASAANTVSQPGWTVTIILNGAGGDLLAAGLIQSDTEIVFQSPAGYFNYDTTITLDFNYNTGSNVQNCVNFPRDQVIDFHYGPLCSSVSPANGHLSGNELVSLAGSHLSLGLNTAQISVRVCLDRLNPSGGCSIYETPDIDTAYSISDSQITFNTPSIRKNVPTNVGGNRIFGDDAGIYLFYGSIPSSNLFNGPSDQYVYCGEYRFGPIVKKISPTKGPEGPAVENSPATPIVVSGSGFNDPLYDVTVTLGEVNTVTTDVSDSSIGARTLWGGYAGSDSSVNVIFNSCNTTSSSSSVHWGPEIVFISGPVNPILSSYNPNQDVYGILPQGGQIITVVGSGFATYITASAVGEGDIEYAFDGTCEIGGVLADTVVVPVISGESVVNYNIECIAPALSFGTEAHLTLTFGSICGDSVVDYKHTATSSQSVFYTPRIDYFYPVYGLTSGGTDVTIIGEGFTQWDNYTCYFGHYTNGVDLADGLIQADGSALVCQTPYHRGEFNTDVTVHVELSHEFDQKVWANTKFHYGPICTNIIPSSGYIRGGYNAFITGDGFIDCKTDFSSPFRNCTFDTFGVFFTDARNNTNVTHVAANITSSAITETSFEIVVPVGECMLEPQVTMYFPNVLVTYENQRYVVCDTTDRDFFFHYGPLFSYQNSTFYRGGVSYGWQGDTVTINGINFADPDLNTPKCFFGANTTSAATLVDDTQIHCLVPEGNFNTQELVQVGWSRCNNETKLVTGSFHYGPVLDTIFPPRGYVFDRTVVTITGFAFECCGISQYEVLWPSGALANGKLETGFITPNSVIAPVPSNTDIDVLIDYIGVKFNSTKFDKQNVTFISRTESGGYLSYYYGPYVYDVSPKVSSLSGRGESVTITGEGFLDPYFIATFCDFFSTTDGNDDLGSSPVIPLNDNTIVCPIKTFNHECGDIDNVRPRWERVGTSLRQELGHTYYKTLSNVNQPIPNENQFPYFADAGSVTPSFLGPITYGPVITGIEELNQVESSTQFYNSPVDGGLILKISFDNLEDWLATNNAFGNEQAICKFGDRFSEVVPIVKSDVDGDIEYYVVCTVPPLGEAGWDVSALIEVILDPYVDDETYISASNPSFHWRWLPYVESLSKTIAQVNGREVITIQGGGFCGYDGVVCYFGNNQAKEADVTNDYVVTCQTPANTPGYYDVTLQFCEDSQCYSLGTFDRVAAPVQFTYAGVSGISPLEGSICGGSPLTIFGYGFNFYDQLTVQFGNEAEVPATVINDNTLTCTTPDLSPLHVNSISFAECSNIVVVGKYGGAINFPMLSPINFEFGSPFPTTAVPSSADVDTVTEIIVNGRYFGGGEIFPGGEYYCKFGELDPVPAYLYNYTEGDSVDVKYSLICYTPNTLNTPSLTIGDYDLSIQFSCQYPSFHSLKVPFSFTRSFFSFSFIINFN